MIAVAGQSSATQTLPVIALLLIFFSFFLSFFFLIQTFDSSIFTIFPILSGPLPAVF